MQARGGAAWCGCRKEFLTASSLTGIYDRTFGRRGAVAGCGSGADALLLLGTQATMLGCGSSWMAPSGRGGRYTAAFDDEIAGGFG